MTGCIYGLLWWCSQGGFWYFFPVRNQANSFLGCFWNFCNQIRRRGDGTENMKWSFSEKINQGEQSEASKGGEIAVVRRFMGSSSVHCLLYFSHTLVGRVVRVDFRCHSWFLLPGSSELLHPLPAPSCAFPSPSWHRPCAGKVHLDKLPEAALLYVGRRFSAASAEHQHWG